MPTAPLTSVGGHLYFPTMPLSMFVVLNQDCLHQNYLQKVLLWMTFVSVEACYPRQLRADTLVFENLRNVCRAQEWKCMWANELSEDCGKLMSL